jgi:subtilisin family serine protease
MCDNLGTHVAGIAAGTVYGVAKRARLHAVKVLNAQGRGRISDLIQGIMYVANQQPSQSRSHIRIANLSLNAKRSVALDDAAAHAADAGVLLVVAAGNTRADACLSSPIASGRTIAVGAIDHNDRLASFSAFGRCVNVLAPGVDILSIRPNGGTRVASGTR